MEFDYYKAPPDKVFQEIKQAAIIIWCGYTEISYREEKLGAILDLENISDNAWFMVAMFDPLNQNKLIKMVSPVTASWIKVARGY